MVARSPADKLRSSLPKVPVGVPRRQSATRRALIAQAERLFTAHGYAATSLDTIVRRAKVTKGALYHHFSGKQAVFEAVFEKIEADGADQVRKSLKGLRDPWEKAQTGLRAFLEVVRDPGYQRVVIQEGPAVLGYERFREQEERSSYGLVQDLVGGLLTEAVPGITEAMVDTFARIFWGALSAAGESVTDSEDPAATSAQVENALGLVMTGLRGLAGSTAAPERVDEEDPAEEDAG